MTICVGILCTDGVVIASDSMASSPILGMNNQKVYEVPCGIVAISGSDFLGKFFVHELNNKAQQFEIKSDPYEFTSRLSNLVIKHIYTHNPGIEHNINQMLLNQQQRNELFSFVDLCALVGFKIENTYYLAKFQPASFNSLFAACITKPTDRTFWQIIGSGYQTSAPLVALLCDILNIKDKPTLQQGKVLAYWLVKYAIDNASQYIGGEVDILQYSNTKNIEKIDYQECEAMRTSLMEHVQAYSKPEIHPTISIPNV